MRPGADRTSPARTPRWRGRLHKWCFVASIPAGVALVATAPTGRAAFAGAVFAYGISLMFGASALFHRTSFDDHGWHRFRRVDHAAIYICIAGGFTPFGMIALDGWSARAFLGAGWVGAGLGITLRFLPFRPPYGMMNTLFLTLGWVSVLVFPELWDNVGHGWMILVMAGGLIYTLGALVVGARRPDPWPDFFGYHEVWHAMVALAATLHYLVVAFEVLPMAAP